MVTADWGVGRFIHIGIWRQEVMAPIVGVVEIVCGALLFVVLSLLWGWVIDNQAGSEIQ
jgi:hypothetical protein